MQSACRDAWPSLGTKPIDVPLAGMHAPCMAKRPYVVPCMSKDSETQHVEINTAPHTAPTSSRQTPPYDSLIGPTFFHSHPDGSRLEAITHSPKLSPHSSQPHHEQSSSTLTSSRTHDGEPRTSVEQSVLRTLPRRVGELCPNLGPPPDCNGVESSVANPEPATTGRNTTTTNNPQQVPLQCLGPASGAPIPNPDEVILSPTSPTTNHFDEFIQCRIPRPTARSHFPLPGSKQDKHLHAGRRTLPLHHHVLKPQPAIYRVRHALGQARRTRSIVSHQNHNSETPVPTSTCSEDSAVLGSPE